MIAEKVNTPATNQLQNKMGKIDLDPRSESLVVSIKRCQDANAVTLYDLSKLFTVKFSEIFAHFLKYFVTFIFSLSYDGWRDMSVLVTCWTDVMFYEERMATK